MSQKKNALSKPPTTSHRLQDDLMQAESLLKQHKPAEARQLLEELDARHPNRVDVIMLLVNASFDQHDITIYEWAIYRLSRLTHNNPEILIGLAGAYMKRYRPGLALHTFESVLKRWPDTPRGAEIRKTITELRALIPLSMPHPELSEAELLNLAASQDEVLFLLEHNQLQPCIRAGERLLKTYPRVIPVMNNLTQAYLSLGNLSESRRIAHAVLKIDAENIHALSSLARLFFLDGDFPAAREVTQRITVHPSQPIERWAKMSETYSLLGDDQSQIALYAQAEQAGALVDSPECAVFLHHCAAALARNGKEQQARSLWKKALKYLPSYDLPRQNLTDLDLPDGERNGPWAHNLISWVSAPVYQEMLKVLSAPAKGRNHPETENATRKFLRQHPALNSLLPHMLARGDANTRQCVTRLLQLANTPEMIELLKDFALSDRGTDQLRNEAASFLIRNNHLPSGANRMWIKGKWTEIRQMDIEITSESMPDCKLPAAIELASQAVAALGAENWKLAQELLEKALKIEEAPSLLNNLSLALEMQGQSEQARKIASDMNTRFPDYFFGIYSTASLAINQGDFEKARALLMRLTQRNRLHITEYEALCEAQIQLALAMKNPAGGRTWFEAWEKVHPDDPRLNQYRVMLSRPGKLLELMRKSLGKK